MLDGLPPGRDAAPLCRLGGAGGLLPPLRRAGRADAAAPAWRGVRADASARRRCAVHRAAGAEPPAGPRPDRDALDRIYLPASWMALAGGEAGFFDPANAAPRRAVLDAALDRVAERTRRRGRPAAAARVAPPGHGSHRHDRPGPAAAGAAARAPTRCWGASRWARPDVIRAFLPAAVPRTVGRGAGARACRRRGVILHARHGGAERRAAARAVGRLCLLPRGRRHRRRRDAGCREASLPRLTGGGKLVRTGLRLVARARLRARRASTCRSRNARR